MNLIEIERIFLKVTIMDEHYKFVKLILMGKLFK